jgi:hypothetical protein
MRAVTDDFDGVTGREGVGTGGDDDEEGGCGCVTSAVLALVAEAEAVDATAAIVILGVDNVAAIFAAADVGEVDIELLFPFLLSTDASVACVCTVAADPVPAAVAVDEDDDELVPSFVVFWFLGSNKMR